MADLSRATLKRGKKQPQWTARCLEHDADCHQLMGGQEDFDSNVYLAFKCSHAGNHIFIALPPDGWPRAAADQMIFLNQVQKGDRVLV